jgi:hypothetical protein
MLLYSWFWDFVILFCLVLAEYIMGHNGAEWPEWWPESLMANLLPDESIMCWVARMVARVLSGQLLSWRVHHGLIGGHYYCRLSGQSPWWWTTYLMSPSCAEWPGWWPGLLMANYYLPDESITCWVARMVARVLDDQTLTWWVHHVLSG